jgi:hypothetical protein
MAAVGFSHTGCFPGVLKTLAIITGHDPVCPGACGVDGGHGQEICKAPLAILCRQKGKSRAYRIYRPSYRAVARMWVAAVRGVQGQVVLNMPEALVRQLSAKSGGVVDGTLNETLGAAPDTAQTGSGCKVLEAATHDTARPPRCLANVSRASISETLERRAEDRESVR